MSIPIKELFVIMLIAWSGCDKNVLVKKDDLSALELNAIKQKAIELFLVQNIIRFDGDVYFEGIEKSGQSGIRELFYQKAKDVAPTTQVLFDYTVVRNDNRKAYFISVEICEVSGDYVKVFVNCYFGPLGAEGILFLLKRDGLKWSEVKILQRVFS